MRHSVYLATTSLTADDTESCKTVVVLDDLLSQSIHLCSLYKNARRQSSDTRSAAFRTRGSCVNSLCPDDSSKKVLIARNAVAVEFRLYG